MVHDDDAIKTVPAPPMVRCTHRFGSGERCPFNASASGECELHEPRRATMTLRTRSGVYRVWNRERGAA